MEKRMFTTQGNISGDRIRVGRAMRKFTQADLAKELNFLGNANMTRAIIGRIEQGDRHVCDEELKQIAQALDVSVDWLIQETNDPERKK